VQPLYQSLRLHPVTTCIHCGKPVSVARRRRGLCRRCYGGQPRNTFRGVRSSYPTTIPTLPPQWESTHNRDFSGPARPAPKRSTAEPGPSKLTVLEARARRQEALFRADEPSYPVHMPDPEKDWNAMRLWRLLVAINPSLLDDFQPAG
jgi:hypothetical protein